MQYRKPPQLYSVPEAAKLLAVSTKTMWRLIYGRKITSVRINRRVLVSEDAICDFIESMKQHAVDAPA